MTRTKPSASAVYCRLSVDRTGESIGIDRQEDLCRRLADEKGWAVAEVYVDRDLSAYSGKRRPSFERMLDDLKNHQRDAVIVVDQDRLTRTPRELESFIDLADANGIALASVSGEVDLSTSDGRFRARIMGTVARQESEKKSERLKRQREQAARLGHVHGGTRRYGYEPDGMTIRRAEAKIVRDNARRLLAGESMRAIVMDLNARGIPTAKGGQWTISGLRRLMVSARLAGLREYHGEVVGEAVWKPIIDRNTHEQLRALLVDGKPASRGRPPTSLLGGIGTCARCGARLHQTSQRGLRVYRCSSALGSKGSCGGVTVRADDLDDLISEAVLLRIDTPAVGRALRRKPKQTSDKTQIDDLRAIDADLEALAADLGEGRISRREWLAARDPLERRRTAALAELEPVDDGHRALDVLRSSGNTTKAWATATTETRRDVLRALIATVTVGPTIRHGSNTFDPDRISVEWKV
jgi:site-specific DNA recombinase